MRNTRKQSLFYVGMLSVFALLMFIVTKQGEAHQSSDLAAMSAEKPSGLLDGFNTFSDILINNINHDFAILLLQIIVILITARIFAWIFKKIGQPTVIGEIVAGILLGPSFLGILLPEVSNFLFHPDSLNNITLLSNFGLILFMFTIGMELDMSEVKKKMRETIQISHAGIIFPFILGVIMAYFVYDTYAPENVPFLPFALFIGISMSITAFPVLARIMQERGLTKSYLGTITLASAANGDITAWCLLAVVVAVSQAGSVVSSFYNILFSILYIIIMFLVIRPFLKMIGNLYKSRELISKTLVAFLFVLLLVSAYLTEILGLHALFGAFIAGVIMPEHTTFRKILTEKVEDVALALFLPLFFVSSGLRTELGLLNTPELWLLCFAFIIIAIVGKFGGSYIAARVVGENRKNSLYIGALMNTRGLMELVVLSIGYEMGILSPTIFAILVLMTLITTFMTTPFVAFISWCDRRLRKKRERASQKEGESFRILLSFGRASSGPSLLRVAHRLFGSSKKKMDVTALHLTVGTDVNPMHADNYEEQSFSLINEEAKHLGIPLNLRYEVSGDAVMGIVNIANSEFYDFLLVGAGVSYSNDPEDIEVSKIQNLFFGKSNRNQLNWLNPVPLLKDKTREFIEQARCSVGVFINRDLVEPSKILIPIASSEDLNLLSYTRSVIRMCLCDIDIMAIDSDKNNFAEPLLASWLEFEKETPRTHIFDGEGFTNELFSSYNFMIISYDTWNKFTRDGRQQWQRMPSTLIINHKK